MNYLGNCISITDAHENNLHNFNISLPKNKLIVFAGVSGSGKSSLVFSTIAVESMRQMQQIFPLYLRNRMPHYQHPKVQTIDGLSTAVVIDQKPFSGDMRSTVGTMSDISPMLRLLYSRCAEPSAGAASAYSFNDPSGMCPACGGIGNSVVFDFAKLFDKNKSLNEGAILFPGHQVDTYQWMLYANSGLLDPDKCLAEYSEKEWHDFLHGSGVIVEISNAKGKVWDSYNLTYEGFLDRINRLYLNRDVNTQTESSTG